MPSRKISLKFSRKITENVPEMSPDKFLVNCLEIFQKLAKTASGTTGHWNAKMLIVVKCFILL